MSCLRCFLRSTLSITIYLYAMLFSKIQLIYEHNSYWQNLLCTHSYTPVCACTHAHTHIESVSPVKNTLLQASVCLLKSLLLAHYIEKGWHLCGLSTSRPIPTKTSNEDVIVFRNHVPYFMYIIHKFCTETKPTCNLAGVQIRILVVVFLKWKDKP